MDLRFYESQSTLPLEVQRNGAALEFNLDLRSGEGSGIELEPLTLRRCNCDCLFCFVHQLPPGLRSSLYVKDEDYRFSFLFGNYLSLVGFSSSDLERVLRLRLSPLYVSIHTTNAQLRGSMLGVKQAPILPLLEKLIAGGIRLHGQMVIVPELNDGLIFQRSLDELIPLYPGLESLSVVPVGLTDHRLPLDYLRPVNSLEAQQLLKIIHRTQKRLLAIDGCRWVYPADELLLKAGAAIPPAEYYADYPQLENGVGMIRNVLEQAETVLSDFPADWLRRRRLLWVTGISAFPTIKKLALMFYRSINNLKITVLPIENRLLGKSVTVAGLLGGEDILSGLQKYFHLRPRPQVDMITLPPDCINSDGFLLDDFTPAKIQANIGVPVQVFEGDWQKLITGYSPGESS